MATPMENNTEGLQEILQQVNALPNAGSGGTVQKYGKLVVFGDSLGQGTNNNDYSFVDILAESGMFESVVKACVGGASIGPYSIYDVNDYCMTSQIERYADDIREADIIICEYGGNDVFALLEGNVEMGTASDSANSNTICGYAKKAINRIYELNPDVPIQWVHFGSTEYDVMNMTGGFYDHHDNMKDGYLLFAAEALRVVKSLGCKLMKINFWSNAGFVSDDTTHPNTAGQQYIANTIMKNLFCDVDIGRIIRPLVITGDISSNSNVTANGDFKFILGLLNSGASVPLTVSGLCYNLVIHNSSLIGYNTISDAGALLNVAWFPDGIYCTSVNLAG